MSKANKQEIAEQIERLREWIKPGDTVYTILEHVSRSGMRRTIRLVIPKTDENGKPYFLHPNHAVSVACGYTRAKHPKEGVTVDGCGMDMGFDIVYNLSHVLYGDGYAVKHSWL